MKGRPDLPALLEDACPAPAFWIASLRGEDDDLRTTAIRALAALGPPAREALPALMDVLNDHEMFVDALDAIHKIDPPSAVPLLLNALSDPREHVRRIVMEYLGDLGAEAGSAVPFLLARMRRSDGSIHAAQALMRIGAVAVAPLISALDDPSPDLRAWAAWTLGGLGQPEVAAVPALLRRLEDADALVRAAAVETLGRIGFPAAIAFRALEKSEGDPDESVRRLASFAVRRIGMPEARVAPLRAVPELHEGFDCGTADAEREERFHRAICKRPR